MTDGDRLLKCLLDDPGDLLARAALADWLEDRGDGRAALVRDLVPGWLWVPFGGPALLMRVTLDRFGDLTGPASVAVYREGGARILQAEFLHPAPAYPGAQIRWSYSSAEAPQLTGIYLEITPADAMASYHVLKQGFTPRPLSGTLSRYSCGQSFKRRLVALLPDFWRPGKGRVKSPQPA